MQIDSQQNDRSGSLTAARLGQRRGSFTPHDGHEGKQSARRKRANNGNQAARLARSPANAALPVRVASDIVSKKSDCRTGLLFPAV
jgi:hypothetical protein